MTTQRPSRPGGRSMTVRWNASEAMSRLDTDPTLSPADVYSEVLSQCPVARVKVEGSSADWWAALSHAELKSTLRNFKAMSSTVTTEPDGTPAIIPLFADPPLHTGFRKLTSDTDAAFQVELAPSGTVLEVPADQTLLAVLEDAGADVISSCAEGTCGSCETKVLAGEIDHRDSVLSDSERAAGDCMMIRVSRCRGPKLVVDL